MMIYLLSYGLTSSRKDMHHLFYDTNNCVLCYAEHFQNEESEVDIISIDGYVKNGEDEYTNSSELISPPIKFKINTIDVVYYSEFRNNEIDIFAKLVKNKIEELIFSKL